MYNVSRNGIKTMNNKSSYVPHQVAQLIDSMLSKDDNLYLRGNYRARLDIIQEEINKAIRKYDYELQLSDASKQKTKRA